MKTYKDKLTGNVLAATDPFVIEQYEKRPERYQPVAGKAAAPTKDKEDTGDGGK